MATIESVHDRDVSVGRVFERAFSAIRHNPAATIGLACLLGALPALVSGLLFTSARANVFTDGSLGTSAIVAFYGLTILNWVLALVIFALTLAALTRVTVAHSEGDKASIGESLMAGMAVLLPLIAVGILYAVAVMVGLMFFIVPGAILYVVWSVAVPALVEERTGVFGAFGRSRELTRGARWKIFAIVLILFVLYYLVSAASAFLTFSGVDFAAMGESGGFDMPVGFWIVSVVVGTLVNVVWATVLASLYVELREWKDGPATDALEQVFA